MKKQLIEKINWYNNQPWRIFGKDVNMTTVNDLTLEEALEYIEELDKEAYHNEETDARII